jgi:hypothetical protein
MVLSRMMIPIFWNAVVGIKWPLLSGTMTPEKLQYDRIRLAFLSRRYGVYGYADNSMLTH